MSSLEPSDGRVGLRVNGSVLAVGDRPELASFENALRGVALSDSPVLIRGQSPDRKLLAERLHRLGRRAELPLRMCFSPDDAEDLFRAVGGPDSPPEALGTWALYGVASWPRELQLLLHKVLETLDEGRLHGRLAHERIPRVLVLEEPDDTGAGLEPELQRRLTFFSLAMVDTKEATG